jgi:hypothetical protein
MPNISGYYTLRDEVLRDEALRLGWPEIARGCAETGRETDCDEQYYITLEGDEETTDNETRIDE